MIEDDWDSVVDAYQLDQDQGKLAANPTSSLNANDCMRIIKNKYAKIEMVKTVTYGVKVHLMYN